MLVALLVVLQDVLLVSLLVAQLVVLVDLLPVVFLDISLDIVLDTLHDIFRSCEDVEQHSPSRRTTEKMHASITDTVRPQLFQETNFLYALMYPPQTNDRPDVFADIVVASSYTLMNRYTYKAVQKQQRRQPARLCMNTHQKQQPATTAAASNSE